MLQSAAATVAVYKGQAHWAWPNARLGAGLADGVMIRTSRYRLPLEVAMPLLTPQIVGQKTSVVVVDDQTAGRKILARLIRDLDPSIEVSAFSEASSALKFIQTSTPDLIITDYLMPEINGVAFIRRARSLPRCANIPIIMVTVVEDRRIRYEALDAGATDFINRPIDQHECRARCRNLLTLRHQQRIITNRAQWLEEQVSIATQKIAEREQETLIRLARAGEYRDENTGNHVERMAKYCSLIAQRLGLSAADCEVIERAAPMHDIGKIGIPDHILLKPGCLTDDEFSIMQRHTLLGYEILCGSPSVYLQVGATIALGHHEKFDGSGYPYGLAGEAIPQSARIVAVADVFDALTSVRPYKPAWSSSQAVEYIESLSGQAFDPACVEAFLASLADIEAVRRQLSDDANAVAQRQAGA